MAIFDAPEDMVNGGRSACWDHRVNMCWWALSSKILKIFEAHDDVVNEKSVPL